MVWYLLYCNNRGVIFYKIGFSFEKMKKPALWAVLGEIIGLVGLN